MANLKEIRKRIVSVKSTQQITRAMKMVSAAKLKKAQDAIIKIRPYSGKLRVVMESLGEGLDDLNSNPFYDVRPENNVLIIVITSDKGLCGSFNSNIYKETLKLINHYKSRKDVTRQLDFICIGKKGADFLKKNGYNVLEAYTNMAVNIRFDQVDPIASRLLEYFTNKEYDIIQVVYNTFKNPAVFYTTAERYLPIDPEQLAKKESGNTVVQNFIFEPNEEEIISELIPASLKITFYRYVLESNASEHGSRMTTMDNATENAEELIDTLQHYYNKERQAVITKEILEIVGGSNALKQG